jgi:CheY-like chemotaxis protein
MLQEEVQKNQKLESLGILAGGIAHDFNNLLGGIFGYIDLAREETRDEKVGRYLMKTLQAIDRAKGLTGQLLTFAKGGEPVKTAGWLFPFIEETAKFALSGSSVSCDFNVARDLWLCNFDRNQIGQVFDNLIINAMQAMPGGGAINITAQNVSLGEREHGVLRAGRYVKLSVTDSGIGIPPEYLPRIFDPFYTTKAKGHGLGLATSYSIVNRHGGCIEVESQPGKGSVFHVFLPALSASETPAEEESAVSHAGSGTFVVMDDEAMMRETISDMLSSLGYSVTCVANGQEAIDFFSVAIKAGRKVAAMIFDLTVPGGLGGREAIGKIRTLDPKIPVFVASGYAEDPVMANPEKFGFTASICKPFRKAELVKMLNAHLI